MQKTCILCRNGKNRIIFREYDIDILKCLNCGHVYSSYDAEQHFDGYFGYDEIDNRDQHWWNEAHEKMYREFCERFLKGKIGRLLDVGCGLGYFVKKAMEYPGWEVCGYEISRSAVNYAKNKLGLSNISQGKVEDSGFQDDYFDIITIWDVIEHIPDPHPVLKYLSNILKQDGILFMHTPNAQIQVPKAKV